VHSNSSVSAVTGTSVINESIFPFTEELLAHPSSRKKWYLQQLIKLYAWQVIPDILPQYLVIDADTFFLRPTQFICPTTGRAYLTTGTEYNPPYFDHMCRMHPSLRRATNSSGIAHHMLFERRFLEKLFALVNRPFWRAFFDCIDPSQFDYSGASEYEMYFHFVVANFPEEVIQRTLQWSNVSELTSDAATYNDYVSCHWYMRAK
jgi:hypothetical protein